MFFKKITAIILFFAAFCIQNASFGADFKVKDLVLDNSDKTVLIRGNGNFKTTTTSLYAPIPNATQNAINLINNISTFTLTNPARYIIDIPNASLNGGSRYYKLKNSKIIQKIDLIQQSANPAVVRVSFTLVNASDLNKFKTYTDGSNIVVKYNNQIVSNSIQYKFYTPSGDTDKTNVIQNTTGSVIYNSNLNTTELEPKLKSKYYLTLVSQNSTGLILRGVGQVSYQKANYNSDNTKAELYLDSTTLLSKLENKTYSVPSLDNKKITLTINQSSSNKVKLTLLGESLRDYRFVTSPDGQSIFISHRTNVLNTTFALNNAKITSYNLSKNENGYYIFDIGFDSPIAYDVFELNDSLYFDVDNLANFNEILFNQTLKKADLTMQAMKISSDKTRYIIPLKNVNFAYANIESNSKSAKLCFKEKPAAAQKPNEIVVIPNTKQQDNKTVPVSNLQKDNSKSGNINVVYVPKEDDTKIIYKEPKKKKENPTISALRKVVLDPGHGGSDSGAIGGGNVYEKTLNLEVAKLVEQKLIKKNIKVEMTRTKDEFISLEERVNFSNDTTPDIYVSIHANSTVQDVTYGLETHYYKDDSLELAQIIHKNFASDKNLEKWETKNRGVIKSRFYVINHTEAPSVLIEMGFISNPTERSKLIGKKRQEEIAQSITDGILEYLNLKYENKNKK